MIEIKTRMERFEGDLWHFHIPIPKSEVEPLLEGDRRVICDFDGQLKIHCALMHDGLGDFFINLNQEVRKKLKLEEGQELTVVLSKDTSKYGMEMPLEFEELLKQDDEGNKVFHDLTLGKQRTLIHIIAKPKSEHIRLNKALAILNYLKETGGVIDYKAMNQAIRDFRL